MATGATEVGITVVLRFGRLRHRRIQVRDARAADAGVEVHLQCVGIVGLVVECNCRHQVGEVAVEVRVAAIVVFGFKKRIFVAQTGACAPVTAVERIFAVSGANVGGVVEVGVPRVVPLSLRIAVVLVGDAVVASQNVFCTGFKSS